MNQNEILITVKPMSHRDMVKFALQRAGFKIVGSGYMLDGSDVGDLVAELPPGAKADEFHPIPIETNRQEAGNESPVD